MEEGQQYLLNSSVNLEPQAVRLHCRPVRESLTAWEVEEEAESLAEKEEVNLPF